MPFLAGLIRIATTTSSNCAAARSKTSMWPNVTGSKDPGHTAPLICAALSHRVALPHRGRSSAPLLLIAPLCIVAGGHLRRSSSSLRSASSPAVICAAPPHRSALHRRRRSSAPLLLIAPLCIVAGGHLRRSPSSLRSASSPAVICAAPPHRSALHRRRRSSAPLLLIAPLCIVAGGHDR